MVVLRLGTSQVLDFTKLAKLLVQEVVPSMRVPETLLSDRGTNLLSHLMQEICALLGIQKLSTIPYHPSAQWPCGKIQLHIKMLHKEAVTYGAQWDNLFQACCGRIEIPLMTPQGRSYLFFYLVLIVVLQLRQHYFHQLI